MPRRTVIPALLRGCLRLGARVCGAPAVDVDFRVADLFVLLGLGAREPSVGRFPRAVRITAVVLVLLLSLVSVVVLPVVGGRGRHLVTWTIFRGVLLAMGVRLVVHGAIPGPGRGTLVVNNHTSWLDIVAVNAVRPRSAGWPTRCGPARWST